MSEINNWIVLRRLGGTPSGVASSEPYYQARCPTCHAVREITVSFIEKSPACQACVERIRNHFSEITPDDKKRIEARYLEHLRMCRAVNVSPSTLISFIADFASHPELLDEESIVFADEPSSASPLTWGTLLPDA